MRTVQKQTGCTIQGDLAPISAPPDLELVVYQVAKEALNNAVLHARANVILVKLSQVEQSVRLEVADDGIGFDSTIDYAGHYGIQIMRERTRALGGQLYIDSSPGE